MGTQHTPGPRIVRANDETGVWDVLQDGMWLVAFESESLAYEFAAAPELLEACQLMADCAPHADWCATKVSGSCDCPVSKCTAAIANAQGGAE